MTVPDGRRGSVGAQRRLLIVIDAHFPGWRAGGPTQSIANLVDNLGDSYEICILTRNHDYADPRPYPDVTPNRWIRVGKSLVYYADDEHLRMHEIQHIIGDVDPDLVYLNSILSRLTMKYLVVRRLRHLGTPVLVAPRGEFSGGALGIKAVRKRIYFAAGGVAGLFRGLHWHASSEHEALDIQQSIGSEIDIHTVSNPAAQPPGKPAPPPPKVPGAAKFVSVARVSRMKNLPYLLEAISRVQGNVTLSLVGGRDPGYWPSFEDELASLPSHVTVSWKGALPPAQVGQVLAESQFFVLPTLGENFGHAIYEALRIGRPVVVSDKTPWRDLSGSMAGWDISLNNEQRWVAAMQRCIDMDQEDYRSMANGAHALATQWFNATHSAEEYSAMFEEVVRGQK